MGYLFDQQRLQVEQAANALGRHISTTASTTARELYAGISRQHQFGGTLPSLEEQGNRLPSTVALQLARQLKTQPYDVILEKGSGVTTNFMAHTIKNTTCNENEKISEQTELDLYVDSNDDNTTY